MAKRSEHGLGHLIPPCDNFEDDLCEWIINTDLGQEWSESKWINQPALGRTTVNTLHDLRLLKHINQDKPYKDQIRPGGFLTIAHPHPVEERGLLIVPFTKDFVEALASTDCIHRATGRTGLGIRTDRPEYVIEANITVLDYRHYVAQYRNHRDWKATVVRRARSEFNWVVASLQRPRLPVLARRWDSSMTQCHRNEFAPRP